MNYSKLEKFILNNGKYMSFYTTKNEKEIKEMLLDNLYWKYIINSGCIKRIIHKNSYQLVVYQDNGIKLVYSK